LNFSGLARNLVIENRANTRRGARMSNEAERLYERLLVLRCQTGDEDAYRELVGRFGPRLTYFLRKLAGQAELADDLAQEVWIDVLRQLPRLADAGAFTTWLYRIARGKVMLEARRNGRAPVTIPAIDEIAGKEEPQFSPDDAARIHAALDRLEPPQREVLVLRFLEELSYDQIAQVTDCPVGTVRSRIHYAKAALQRVLHRDAR
jgi:RNA polymerase sigma-70 factor (ECF subfamily)